MGNVIKDNIHVLLVDDNKENIDVLETILKKEGRIFYKAFSGEEAIEMTKKHSFGLIMLDVQMKGLDGFEVARILKKNEQTQDIAIIFVTGVNKSVEYMEKGFDEGAVDYLYKPLDFIITKKKVDVFETIYFQKKELIKSNEEILRINKQLDQFAYVVSHDLKAPLRGINSLITWIKEDLEKNEGKLTDISSEYLQMVQSRVVRMDELIIGALDYSRVSRKNEKTQLVDINVLINEICEMLNLQNKIKINLATNLPILTTEKHKLSQVFQNLIDNAIKYNDKQLITINIDCVEEGNYFRFNVNDNGMGVKKEYLTRIFDIFQTTKTEEDRNSTGIGLAIVKRLVEDKGGEVKAESEFGVNTTISFTWPDEKY